MLKQLLCIIGILAFAILLSSNQFLSAQQSQSSSAGADTVPRLITINGTLKSQSGQPLTGVVGVTFAIYKDQEGGAALWTENQNVQLDQQGHYLIPLGATQPNGLPIDLFTSGETRWLGVQAQLQGEVEQPRGLLVSVPYALHAANADTIGGKPASAFLLARPDGDSTSSSSVQSPKTSIAASSAPSGAGAANQVAKWIDTIGTLGNSSIQDNGVGVSVMITTSNQVGIANSLTVNGEVLNQSSPAGAPYTQPRLTAYRDTNNWGYIGYGSDATMRLVYGNTAANTPLLVGTTSAPDNTGTFTERMKLTNTGQLLINGEFWNTAAPDGAPYTRSRLTAYKDANNWGYIGYGIDATMRLVFGNTAGNTPLLIGTTSAPDNTGTFTEKMKLTHDGQLLLNGEFYNTTGGDPAPYTKARLTAYRDANNWGYIGYGNDAIMRMVYSSTAMGSPLLFGTTTATDNTGAFTEKMRLTGSGSLGIGTTNPTSKLEVVGDIKTNGQLISTAATGTAPLTVNSLTMVPNLNANFLNNYTGATLATRGINYLAGCDNCQALTLADNQNTFYVNVVGAMTVNLVQCFTDNGATTINIRRRNTGVSDQVLSSDLPCSTSGATGSLGLSTLNINDQLDFQVKGVDNVAKRVTLVIKTTVN